MRRDPERGSRLRCKQREARKRCRRFSRNRASSRPRPSPRRRSIRRRRSSWAAARPRSRRRPLARCRRRNPASVGPNSSLKRENIHCGHGQRGTLDTERLPTSDRCSGSKPAALVRRSVRVIGFEAVPRRDQETLSRSRVPPGPCFHRLGTASACRAPQPNARCGGGSGNAGYLTFGFRPGADGRRRRLSDRTNREAAGHMRAGPTRQSHKLGCRSAVFCVGRQSTVSRFGVPRNPKSESGRSLHRRDGVPSLPDASDPRAGRVCARALKASPRGRALNTAGRRRANPDPRSWRRRPRAHKLQRVSRSDLWS